MKYAELVPLSPEERTEALRAMSLEEQEDILDEIPYPGVGLQEKPGRRYFDNLETLREYLRDYHVPLTKPWRADRIAEHEGAHAKCALAVGAVAVRYYVLDEMHPETLNQVFTEHYSPEPMPNLAWAAIAMHPARADRSITDMRLIRSYGYESRAHVSARIQRWNKQDNGLYIPEPEQP